MGKVWTQDIQPAERRTGNSGTKGNVFSTRDISQIAFLTGAPYGKVSAWFNPRQQAGVIPIFSEGDPPCFYLGESTMIRLLIGFCLGYPGGLTRLPLYTGRTRVYYRTFEDLGEIAVFTASLMEGKQQLPIGFKISKAWVGLLWQPEGENWSLAVTYNALSKNDESDPAEDCGGNPVEEIED